MDLVSYWVTLDGQKLGDWMRPWLAVIVLLLLSGCAAQRAAERNAPAVPFKGPLPPVTLTQAQIKAVQKGIAEILPEPRSAVFGDSYRAGRGPYGEIAVCGFVNGKRFVGMFAKPQGETAQFLPIRVVLSEEQQESLRLYCRVNGIYLPQ
jgi:hypothetical protein